jgi:hypothetical protein
MWARLGSAAFPGDIYLRRTSLLDQSKRPKQAEVKTCFYPFDPLNGFRGSRHNYDSLIHKSSRGISDKIHLSTHLH